MKTDVFQKEGTLQLGEDEDEDEEELEEAKEVETMSLLKC